MTSFGLLKRLLQAVRIGCFCLRQVKLSAKLFDFFTRRRIVFFKFGDRRAQLFDFGALRRSVLLEFYNLTSQIGLVIGARVAAAARRLWLFDLLK